MTKPLNRKSQGVCGDQSGGVIVEAALSMFLLVTILGGVISFSTYLSEYQRLSRAVSEAAGEFARVADPKKVDVNDPSKGDAVLQVTQLVAEQLGVPRPAEPRTPAQISALADELGITVAATYYNSAGDAVLEPPSWSATKDPYFLAILVTRDPAKSAPITGALIKFLPPITTSATFMRTDAGSATS